MVMDIQYEWDSLSWHIGEIGRVLMRGWWYIVLGLIVGLVIGIILTRNQSRRKVVKKWAANTKKLRQQKQKVEPLLAERQGHIILEDNNETD